jgi:hypothetical protein
LDLEIPEPRDKNDKKEHEDDRGVHGPATIKIELSVVNMGDSRGGDITRPSADILIRRSFSVLFSEVFHNRFLILAKLISGQGTGKACGRSFASKPLVNKCKETKEGKGKKVD